MQIQSGICTNEFNGAKRSWVSEVQCKYLL